MIKLEKIKLDSMAEGGCIWEKCQAKHRLNEPLPEGWCSILIFPGMGKVNGWNCSVDVRELEVDATLCPEHARMLKRWLKWWEREAT